MDIGWVDEVVTQTYQLSHLADGPNRTKFYIDVTGTIDVSVEFIITPIIEGKPQDTYFWLPVNSNLTAETSDSTNVITTPGGFHGFRFKVNSYSSGAEAQLYVGQH
jgi:hypothetical protein